MCLLIELDRWLNLAGIQVIPFTKHHAFQAGKAHAAYRKAGGKRDRILAEFMGSVANWEEGMWKNGLCSEEPYR